jgi:16S rRNA (guanine966-N2)-methyltransferase
MLRLIAGKHKGRKLRSAPGRYVRPTGARAREAIFDVLAHAPKLKRTPPWPMGARVADVFAGSGALGFEALSRGAANVVFLEKDHAQTALLRENAQALDETADVRIEPKDALNPGPAPWACDLLFLDPPYGEGLAWPALTALATNGWLAGQAIAVVEIAANEQMNLPAGFRLLDERRYGAAKILFVRFTGASEISGA